MNVVCITGRMTRDPEVRYSQSGTAFASFTLAVDRRFKREGEPSADFPNFTALGKTAEFLEKYFSKGMKAEVVGRIQTRSYDGPNGKVYVTEVVADNVQIISNRTGNGMSVSSGNSYAPQNQTFTPAADPGYPDSMDDDFSNTPSLDISSDDLPFY